MNYVHMYHHEEEKKCEKSVIFLTRKSWGKAQVCLWMFIMIKRMQHNSFQKTRLILWILQSFWPGELKFNFLSISNFPMTRGRISLENKKKKHQHFEIYKQEQHCFTCSTHKTPWGYGFPINQSCTALNIDNTSSYKSSPSRGSAAQVYHYPVQ